MSRQILPMHGRTHCPGGSDPIPCIGLPKYAYLTRTTEDAALSFGTPPGGGFSVTVPWKHFSTNDEKVFGTSDATIGTAPSNAVDDIYLLLMKPGVYYAQMELAWNLGGGAFYRQAYIDFVNDVRPKLLPSWGADTNIRPLRYADESQVDASSFFSQDWRHSDRQIGLVEETNSLDDAYLQVQAQYYTLDHVTARSITAAELLVVYWPSAAPDSTASELVFG